MTAAFLFGPDSDYVDEDIPPGSVGVDDIEIRDFLMVDGDGFPHLVDPREYDPRMVFPKAP